jgi:hypothetical protein
MTGWRRFGVALTSVTIGVLGFTLLPAQSAGKGEEVMKVCDQNRRGFNHDVDVEGDGFSAGDYSVFADKLLDTKTGRKAGHLNGQLHIIRPIGNRDAIILGNVLAFFPIGKISVNFGGNFSDFEKGTSFPVTGGAGHFAHATGSVFLKEGSCDGKPGLRLKFVTKH